MEIKAHQDSIDRCRFCFMCRHVCTLGRGTNDEALIPRSQSLGLSMILRDTFDYPNDLAENIYKCCLCDYCKDWCQGGWDFPSAVKAARRDLVLKGKAPKNVEDIKHEIIKNKNAYGETSILKTLDDKLLSYKGSAENLVVFGSDVLYASPKTALSFLALLEKANIAFTVLENENTTGYELYDLGYEKEAKENTRQLIEKIVASEAKRLIVISPDVQNFLVNDIDNLGFSLEGVKITSAVSFLAGLLKEKQLVLSKDYNQRITYQDSNSFARKLNILDEPRYILGKIPKAKYTEMIWYGNEAHSIGSHLTNRLYPKIGASILKKRVKDVLEVNPDIIITANSYDKKAMEDGLDGKILVKDLFELVSELV